MIKDPVQRRYWNSAKGVAKRKSYAALYYTKERSRNSHLKARYGISLQRYNEILLAQGGACATCKRVVKKFHTDHCHLTGAVRGILCPSCNRALGMINENAGTARALAEYLERRR
jgi:Recombination endonuclease VII